MALKQVWQRWTSRYFSDEQAVILLVLLIAGFAAVLWLGRMLAPFLTALVLAFLLQGAVTRLTRRGMSHLTAVITVFVVFVGLLLKVVLLLIPLVWSQLTALVQEIPYIVGQGQELLGQLETRFPNLVSPEQMQAWTAMAGREATQLGQRLLALSLASLGNVMALIIYLVLVPILVFFLLKDRAVLLGFFLPFLPEKRTLMSQVWAEMEVQLSNYVRGKALEILIVGTVSYVTFALFGLPYALLLGILVGLSTLLPYIGAAVITLPVAAVAGFHFGLTQPFSSVDTVSNYMREFGYHVGEYGIAYRESIDEAIVALREAFDELAADETHKMNIVAPLEVAGVTGLGDSSVNIRVRIKTTPGTQWGIGRAYNRLVKLHFDAKGIEIPFPHTTLYFGVGKQGEAPPANVRLMQQNFDIDGRPGGQPRSGESSREGEDDPRSRPNPVFKGDYEEKD